MKTVEQISQKQDREEYLRLGDELRTFTIVDIARKFGVIPGAVTAINRLSEEEIKLIQDSVSERHRLLARRKHLRVMLE
ncbi:MAG: hypothetical protein ACC707_16415 [Thiohalomonadales bacterium]